MSPASSGGHLSSVVLTMSTTVLTGPWIACRTSPAQITMVFGKPLTRPGPLVLAGWAVLTTAASDLVFKRSAVS